jgi:hypothetical protein
MNNPSNNKRNSPPPNSLATALAKTAEAPVFTNAVVNPLPAPTTSNVRADTALMACFLKMLEKKTLQDV